MELVDSVAMPSEFSLFPNTELLVLVEPNGLAVELPNGLLAADVEVVDPNGPVEGALLPNIDPEVVPNPVVLEVVDPNRPVDAVVAAAPNTLDDEPKVLAEEGAVVEEPKTLALVAAPNPEEDVVAAPKTLDVVVVTPNPLEAVVEVPKTLGVVEPKPPVEAVDEIPNPLGVVVAAPNALLSLAANDPNDRDVSWEPPKVAGAPKV